MKQKTLFLLAMTFAIINTAWSQCESTSKSAKAATLFLNNGGGGPIVKTGDMNYAGILIEDKEGVPKVAFINDACTKLFEQGDRIRSINQTAITSAKEWDKVLKGYKKGDKVTITIERGGQAHQVEVVLDTIAVYKSVI